MEVSIPLIQNQVIDHTGTYRIVQRTVNGQTGLVIEEYIPEPEPEEEVLQNNSNTRAMIIDDEEENDNNGQMVLRGQNNVRGLPDSTGTAIEGTFEISITPTTSKINISSFAVSNYINTPPITPNYLLKNMNVFNSSSISVPQFSTLIYIEENSETYYIYYFVNYTSGTVQKSVAIGYKYMMINSQQHYLFFYDDNNDVSLGYSYHNTNESSNIIELYKSKFNLIFD